ncbi:uncharacterized protein LOC100123478 [Nasonia vitripennis]|uniref:F-box domain-containing protein n=1 Tax=Nasonia vitripennis TaxID=7425 RepID=A0A7M7M6H7_NASVI|nr:uncharacterized protein LOC100123478 [Nasonia vitripennis]XP_016838519.1 uncharacterized protein LOC100123478 [Nasonia vitripennis]
MENLQTQEKESGNDNLCTEGIFYDVLDNIFQYLSLKDLCRAAAVCKSWHHRVKIEISKRNDIESLTLPITYESDDNDSDNDEDTFKYLQNKWHFSDSLRSLPHFMLLFHDSTYNFKREHDHFHCYYANYVKMGMFYGCFETSGLSLNTEEVCTIKNLGIGIALPSTDKLKVDCYVPYETDLPDHAKSSTMSRLANEAISSLLSTEDEHNCFIFLRNQSEALKEDMISDNNSFLAEFSNSLKQRCKPGSYSLWGGGVSEITYSRFGRNDFVWLTVIRVSGLALNSWSIVLKMNLSSAEVENKLTNFKKDIHLKSNSLALAMVPSNNNESFQQRLKKTEIFRKIFSNIPLVGVYENTEFTQIGINSLESDLNQVIVHSNSIIYLILTTE